MSDAFGWEAMVATTILVIYIFSAHLIEINNVTWIHESGIAIIFGLIGGIIIHAVGNFVYWRGLEKDVHFNDETFFYFMLPPIIFAAGYTLKRRRFINNLGTVLLLGVIGTLICMVVMGFLLKMSVDYFMVDFEYDMSDCLMLACVLCATDAVAAVAIVKEEEFPVLNAIMFGESSLNDAVTILIYESLKEVTSNGTGWTVGEVFKGIGNFAWVSVTSVLLGGAVGLLCAFLLKNIHTLSHNHLLQVSLMLILGYLAYVIAYASGLSGIMTEFCVGFTMAHYAYYNLSHKARHATKLMFKSIGFIAEAFVFGYLGLVFAPLFFMSDVPMVFTCWVFIMGMVARAITVMVPMGTVWILKGKRFSLSCAELAVLWYAGLIRGAVAFAVSLTIEYGHADTTKTVTLIIVVVSTLFIGGFVPVFANLVGLEKPEEALPGTDNLYSSELVPHEHRKEARTGFHKWFRKLDDLYIKPYFGGRQTEEMRQTILEHKRSMAYVDYDNQDRSFININQSHKSSRKTSDRSNRKITFEETKDEEVKEGSTLSNH